MLNNVLDSNRLQECLIYKPKYIGQLVITNDYTSDVYELTFTNFYVYLSNKAVEIEKIFKRIVEFVSTKEE